MNQLVHFALAAVSEESEQTQNEPKQLRVAGNEAFSSLSEKKSFKHNDKWSLDEATTGCTHLYTPKQLTVLMTRGGPLFFKLEHNNHLG